MTKYRVVDPHGSEAGNFVVDRDDDFAAMRIGLSARDEHSRRVGRRDEQWLGEYQLEKWVAGAWDFAGRYAFVEGVLLLPA